jgi:Domain of unknown function (DUF4337)
MVKTRAAVRSIDTVGHTAKRPKGLARHAAVLVSILAALLAVAALAGDRATTEELLAQQKASDAWTEFQATSLKRHVDEGDATALQLLAAGRPRQAEAERDAGALQVQIGMKYQPSQEHLQEQATELEHERDLADARHRTFQVAEAAFQLAIVLGSIMLAAGLAALLWASAALGVVGLLLLLNGFVLAVALPL